MTGIDRPPSEGFDTAPERLGLLGWAMVGVASAAIILGFVFAIVLAVGMATAS